MSKSVILIEDDHEMQRLIVDYLTTYGYTTTAYFHPKEALQAIRGSSHFDIVILDLMLPDMDGFDVAKAIRSSTDIPIIISSARGDIGNKIYGYELGVDDYLEKPYEPRELILRIEAVLRRTQKNSSVAISGFTIDEGSKSIAIEDYDLELTPIEFEILLFLLNNQGKNVSREQIVNATSLDYSTKARTVDMHVSNIRQKIGDDAKEPRYIKSVWGIGYRFIG